MASYVDSLAKAFMSKHPEVTVVVSGGGAEAGFSALFDKTVEVVMASIPVS